jgi:hypothetical protein
MVLVVAGCFHPRAHDVTAHLVPMSPSSGAIDVVLSAPSKKLTIAVDGNLVVDRAYSRHAHIDGVPAGPGHVQVVVDGHCERGGTAEEDVDVPAGGTATVVLPGPDKNHACMVATGVVHVALALTLIRPAFHLVHYLHARL